MAESNNLAGVKVMVIDDIRPPLRPQQDRDHVPTQEFRSLLPLLGLSAPMLALFRHLAKADGDLRRTQILDRDRLDLRFP